MAFTFSEMDKINPYLTFKRETQNSNKSREGKSTAEIVLLSDNILEIIFSNLSYSELEKIRTVCHWFYYVIGNIFNTKFLSLKFTVDERKKVQNIETLRKLPFDNYRRILCILSNEVKMMDAHISEYIYQNMYFFSAGIILDIIDTILLTKVENKLVSLISELFVLIEQYLDYFDTHIEPDLLRRSLHLPYSWFGKKVVDILECYTNFNYQVVLCPQAGANHCEISAMYEAVKVSSVTAPPKFRNTRSGSHYDMLSLLKYLRNHVRWNNVLNQINIFDKEYENFESEVNSEKSGESQILFTKSIEKPVDPCNKQTIRITLDLFCHKVLSPSRYKHHIGSVYSVAKRQNAGDESTFLLQAIPLNSSDYELNFNMEVVFKDNKKVLESDNYNQAIIQICQTDNRCYIATNAETNE